MTLDIGGPLFSEVAAFYIHRKPEKQIVLYESTLPVAKIHWMVIKTTCPLIFSRYLVTLCFPQIPILNAWGFGKWRLNISFLEL